MILILWMIDPQNHENFPNMCYFLKYFASLDLIKIIFKSSYDKILKIFDLIIDK